MECASGKCNQVVQHGVLAEKWCACVRIAMWLNLALSCRHHLGREISQFADVDPEGTVAGALTHLVQHGDAVRVRVRRHVAVHDAAAAAGQRRELVKVRGEEREGANSVRDVLGNRPGEAKTVVGTGATPELVDDDETVVRGACGGVGGYAW
jgi:hypothetical protein